MAEVRPFTFTVDQSAIDDLRDRLARTRWPDPETVHDGSQGIRLATVRELCRYWAEGYDWSRALERINAHPQFVTEIDGLDIHFLHARSPHRDALVLVLTHGWPGSFVEFLGVVAGLTRPETAGGSPGDAFHVICPSLPGFGFSGRPTSTGWGPRRVASAWRQLVTTLGYERFGVQGGDWGARVSRIVAAGDERVVGTHLNLVMVDPDPETLAELTEAERQALADVATMDRWGRGYAAQQGTRPQTVGYGLNDSPAGLCAWIMEKLGDWSDHRGSSLTTDLMLDNVSIYWFTQTATSSARMYWEGSFESPPPMPTGPIGCTIFPRELRRPSRRWAEQALPDLRYWNEVARGGHFAAWEQPGAFIDEVRAFFRLVR